MPGMNPKAEACHDCGFVASYDKIINQFTHFV
jgi:hypothetical protein